MSGGSISLLVSTLTLGHSQKGAQQRVETSQYWLIGTILGIR